jgi:drug/metabolite transporter (DMT)-like permease
MKFLRNPYLMMFLTCLLWAGGGIAVVLAVGEISVFMVMFFRGFLAFLFLYALTYKDLPAHWSMVKENWRIMLFYALTGFFLFNSLFYIAAHFTTGLNLNIVLATSPMMVLLLSILLFKANIPHLQWGGASIAVLGVVYLAFKGDVSKISNLSLNLGDFIMLVSCVIFGLYALYLPKRPAMPSLVFFTYLTLASLIFTAPAMIIEILIGKSQFPASPLAWGVVIYVGLFTGAISQLTYLKAIDGLGPQRTSVLSSMMPLIGAILAIVILKEQPAFYHAIAALIVVLGTVIAEMGKKKA